MISMILLMLHATQAANQARERAEEYKLESERPGKPAPRPLEKEFAMVNRSVLRARPAARFVEITNRVRGAVGEARGNRGQPQNHFGPDRSRRQSRLQVLRRSGSCRTALQYRRPVLTPRVFVAN